MKVNLLAKTVLIISFAFALLGAYPTLAQGSLQNLRATKVRTKSITVKWDAVSGVSQYEVLAGRADRYEEFIAYTEDTSFTLGNLRPNTLYSISILSSRASGHIMVRTAKKAKKTVTVYVPLPQTCPHLPSRVTITGYVKHTQCQMVDESGVGRSEILERGFIDALDVWNEVPGKVEVCFRAVGWLVFLDADYAPRMEMELDHRHPDGMTCGTIDRAGTLVLVGTAPLTGTHTHPTNSNLPESTLPVSESIPLIDCQVKLVATLFLRAEPAGEIIGLVWLNSEVPAFEINGHWYKVEFEGKVGYISRYHRKVLQGGCG